jgi:glycosyltransferase involved in cell wall biosynthesis
MNSTGAGVLVVVPAYNERESVAGTIGELKLNAPFVDILVVDDGSKDGTGEVAKKMGVKVVRLPFNLGIGGAVQTGFKYAVRSGYDVVVQVDGDGQHDASCLPGLVDFLLSEEADIVVGSRFLVDDPLRMSFFRNLGIRYFSWLTSRVVGQRVTDCSSGFRAVSRRAAAFYAENYPVDFPDAEALILAHRAGLKIAELPARFRHRENGKSSMRFWRFLYYPVKETLSIAMLLTRRGRAV